jgi:hypothetical protein
MFPWILFGAYFVLLLFAWQFLIKRSSLALSRIQVTAIFGFKVLLGCTYGYLFFRYYGGDDTWVFFRDSLPQTDKLLHHPGAFFAELLPFSVFSQVSSFWQGVSFYVQDLEYWSMVKGLAILNIFSARNYYIDVLFLDSIFLVGPLVLFKLVFSAFPGKKDLLVICVFFIPWVTFWLSGIRAEGFLLLFVSLSLYFTKRWFTKKKFRFILWILGSLSGILVFRPEAFFVMMPAFFCWTLASNARRKPFYYFVFVYIFLAILFLGSITLSPSANLATPLVKRQKEYFLLHAKTRFGLDTLYPSLPRVAKVLPEALSNGFLRPFLWEAKGLFQWLCALESVAFWILTLAFLVYAARNRIVLFDQPLLLFLLFYGLTFILMIGYVVPFPGAIARYKSIPELFLIISMTVNFNFKKSNYTNK